MLNELSSTLLNDMIYFNKASPSMLYDLSQIFNSMV